MALDVYWVSGSPHAWRVLLALEIKSVDYNLHQLKFSKGDHKTPEFRALNPRGKVPVVREGEFVLYESLAILGWLEDRFAEPPLFGRSIEEKAQIWQQVMEIELYLHRPAMELVNAVFYATGPSELERYRGRVGVLHRELHRLETRLEDHLWLAGDQITAADIVLLPTVQTVAHAAARQAAEPLEMEILPLDVTYPSIASWIAQIEALPGYKKTHPPHWR